MRTDGTPLVAADTHDKSTVQLGDTEKNPDTQAPAPPPSLRNPGETLPQQQQGGDRTGVMKPVQFPKQKPDDDSNGTSDSPSAPRAAGINAVSGTNPTSPSAIQQCNSTAGGCFAARNV